MKFEEYRIAEGIKKSIAKQGYVKPTDIQYKSIPPILKGEDVLAIAQTGTGKTAAFVIPILHKLQERKLTGRPNGIKCLVMAPTHELAEQITSVFKLLGKHTRIISLCIHGGVGQDEQIKQLNFGVDVLVATPGRMFDLVSQGYLRLEKVETLILDEADHMLDLGFYKDIQDLLRFIPKNRQTLFFSATINERIKKLAYSLVKNAIRIQISPKDPVAKNIDHSVAFIEMDDKRFFLEQIIKDYPESKILVFVRTKIRAERVKKAMERVGLEVDSLHGDKDASERSKTVSLFRKGDLKVVIATDVSARGIDIPNVEYVVNYDLPESSETYVHRVGRTGRGNKKGQAVSFCSSEEQTLLSIIEDNLGKEIKKIELSKSDYDFTVNLTSSKKDDWQALLDLDESMEMPKKKNKKKRK